MAKQRRGSQQRQGSKTLIVPTDDIIIAKDENSQNNDAKVVVAAELISVEPEETKLLPAMIVAGEKYEPKKNKWFFFGSSTSTKTTSSPLFPRSRLGQVVRLVKILLSLLNVIVIRGSVLTRRKLTSKLEEYAVLEIAEEEVVALYHEHIGHHLFVFYLSWVRLIICCLVLMWGTCENRLPLPLIIAIGMFMHWVDSIRALDSSNWLPVSDADDHSSANNPNRESTAEEEVQTAMAWLHLFWFVLDGIYFRQILQRRKQEQQRKEQ